MCLVFLVVLSAIRYIDGICRAARDAVRISMSIVPGSIVVGRCYVTPSREVRRVLEVGTNTVTYVCARENGISVLGQEDVAIE